MEFIDARFEKPEELKEWPHFQQLWISTRKYGEFVGFYYKGKFMRDYACEILDVVAWMKLPANQGVGFDHSEEPCK